MNMFHSVDVAMMARRVATNVVMGHQFEAATPELTAAGDVQNFANNFVQRIVGRNQKCIVNAL